MKPVIEPTELDGVFVIRPGLIPDHRGYFSELWRQDEWSAAAEEAVARGLAGAEHLPRSFAQVNQSRSAKGVIRGLHLQYDPPMGKLMRVNRGRAIIVAVDARPDSPTFGQGVARDFGDDEPLHLWAPAYCARGFCTLTDDCEIQYLCTGTYEPTTEVALSWNDPAITGIDWPIAEPLTSEKDAGALSLEEWAARVRAHGITLRP